MPVPDVMLLVTPPPRAPVSVTRVALEVCEAESMQRRLASGRYLPEAGPGVRVSVVRGADEPPMRAPTPSGLLPTRALSPEQIVRTRFEPHDHDRESSIHLLGEREIVIVPLRWPPNARVRHLELVPLTGHANLILVARIDGERRIFEPDVRNQINMWIGEAIEHVPDTLHAVIFGATPGAEVELLSGHYP